jgi:quercetin dioxygenase-like cupin family protein
MRTTKLESIALIAAGLAVLVAGAQEPPPVHDHEQPHGRSKQEILLQDPLHAIPGKQAHLLRIEYPPGWVGQRHYHTGDVFLYVLSGAFTVDVDGAKRTTIRAGESYHEALDKVMQARNASATEPTTILLFQVGNQGERMTVVTDQ